VFPSNHPSPHPLPFSYIRTSQESKLHLQHQPHNMIHLVNLVPNLSHSRSEPISLPKSCSLSVHRGSLDLLSDTNELLIALCLRKLPQQQQQPQQHILEVHCVPCSCAITGQQQATTPSKNNSFGDLFSLTFADQLSPSPTKTNAPTATAAATAAATSTYIEPTNFHYITILEYELDPTSSMKQVSLRLTLRFSSHSSFEESIAAIRLGRDSKHTKLIPMSPKPFHQNWVGRQQPSLAVNGVAGVTDEDEDEADSPPSSPLRALFSSPRQKSKSASASKSKSKSKSTALKARPPLCSLCSTPFSLLTRRQVCSSCERTTCGDCSTSIYSHGDGISRKLSGEGDQNRRSKSECK